MLTIPPGLQGFSSHTFGQLSIHIFDIKVRESQIVSFRPVFMGSESSSKFSIFQTAKYRVITNLWHFYSYLSDMMNLKIQTIDKNGRMFSSSYCYRLKEKKQILKPQLQSDDLIQNTQERLTVHNNAGDPIGSFRIKIQTFWDYSIHAEVSNLINFQQLLIIQGISPIQSENQLPRQPPQSIIFQGTFQPKKQTQSQQYRAQEKKTQLQQVFGDIGYSQIQMKQSPKKPEFNVDEESKMMEDDIDKLVAEMISKPYDSSRYQDSPSNKKKEPSSKINPNTAKQFYNVPSYQSFEPLQQEIMKPYDTTKNFGIDRVPQMSRPPINRKNSRQKSRQKSQRKSENNSKSVEKKQSMQGQNQNSHLNIKIFELLSSRQDETDKGSYSVRVFLNNDEDQYFSAQGIKQGQNTLFNQNLKIKNTSHIKFIRFTIVNDYGQSCGEGIFNISRLMSVANQKGIFTVNIAQNYQQPIKVNTNKIREVKMPIYRNLRLEVELVEKVQFVQIYLNICNFSIPFSLIRYKIPFTKQTIQFSSLEHFNVFPHNQNTDKIILQVWKSEKIVGQTQISLKQMKSTNSSIINASLEPIYLYDGPIQIKNIFQNGKKVGTFELVLCYGNIKQIHGLLNNMSVNGNKSKKPKQKTTVELDERLGVLVKDKKQKVEAQIQVQIQPYQQQQKSQKVKQQQNSMHDQSITSTNQFLNQNQFPFSSATTTVKQRQKQSFSKQNTIPKVSLVPLSQRICQRLQSIVAPIVPFLQKIKQKCRPHLLFNFINLQKLSTILKQIGISKEVISLIFRQILQPQTTTDMINVNILYDYCTCIQIDGKLKNSIISDTIVVANSFKILYERQDKRKQVLVQSDMQFREMKKLYEKIQIKISLHQYEIISKFVEGMNLQECKQLKENIIEEINAEMKNRVKKQMYEEDIIYQLYGNQQYSQKSVSFIQTQQQPQQSQQNSRYSNQNRNSYQNNTIEDQQLFRLTSKNKIMESETGIFQKNKSKSISSSKQNDRKQKTQKVIEKIQKMSPKKKIVQSISIQGLGNVRESSQCLLDIPMDNAYLRLIIDEPTFEEITFLKDEQRNIEFDMKVQEAEGRVQLCNSGCVISCAPFILIEGIKSVYAMKTKENEFCGLLSIQLH